MPPSLWGNTAESSSHKYSCLAQADPLKLPTKVYKAGTGALKHLTATVLRAFQNGGVGVKLQDMPELKEIASILGMESALLSSISWLHFDEFRDAASFVATCSKHLGKNPILIAFLAAWTQLSPDDRLSSFPLPGPSRDADIRKAICHCFFLHVLTKAFVIAPIGNDTPIQRLFKSIDEKRSSVMKRLIARNIVPSSFCKDCCDHTTFALVKMASVDPAMKAIINHKKKMFFVSNTTSCYQ